MKKLKVGLVGVGRGTAYGSIFSNDKRTEIAALCDINEDNLESGQKEFSLSDSQVFKRYDDLLCRDIDIVVLGSPIPFHADQTVKALDGNIHVLCEVTAANTIKGCQDIAEAAKRSKAKYMLAENCIYMHFSRQWKEFISEGKIGTPFYAEADYVHEIRELVVDKWRAQRAPIHYCSHSLGPILYWMDDYIVKATGSGKTELTLPGIGVGAIDIQVALFETRKGAAIKVARSSVAARRPNTGFYNIYGTKGFLETGRTTYDNIGLRYFEGIDDQNGTEIVISSSDENAPSEALLGGHGTSEYYLVNDFLDSIVYDGTPPIDYLKGLDMTVPGLIAHEAALKGNVWMDVPRFD